MLLFYLVVMGILSAFTTAEPEPDQCPMEIQFPMMEKSGTCIAIGRLCQGRVVTVAGTVCENPTRFSINFQTPDGSIAMTFDVRTNYGDYKNIIVMNYLIANVRWGTQKYKRFDKSQFTAGQDYKLAFTVDGDKFKITNRGEEITSYALLKDTFTWDKVDKLCVGGCTGNITVSLDKPDIETTAPAEIQSTDEPESTTKTAVIEPDQCPMEKEFPLIEKGGTCLDIGRLCQGRVVTVAGTVCEHPERFSINFQTPGGSIAMTFDVRTNYGDYKNIIVMNYLIAHVRWGSQEYQKFDKSQFSARQDYKLAFTVAGDKFLITNRGEELASYTVLKDVFTWDNVKTVCIGGCQDNVTVSLDMPHIGELNDVPKTTAPPSEPETTAPPPDIEITTAQPTPEITAPTLATEPPTTAPPPPPIIAAPCPSPFAMIDGGCYYFNEATRAKRDFLWEAARTECQNLAEGADLVAIETEDEFNTITAQLNTKFPTPTSVNFWTGAKYSDGEAKWVATGEVTNLPTSVEISSHRPSAKHACGRIYYSGKAKYTHRGLSCAKKHRRLVGYVCEIQQP